MNKSEAQKLIYETYSNQIPAMSSSQLVNI